MAEEGSARRAGLAVAAAAVAVVILALWLRFAPVPEAPPPPAEAPAAGPSEAAAPEPVPAPRVSPRDGPIRLDAGDAVTIELADLDDESPLELELALPADVSAKSGRLVLPDASGVELDAQIAGQTGGVALALPAERLRAPGRYLLEIRTDERTALPLRRYRIEIR